MKGIIQFETTASIAAANGIAQQTIPETTLDKATNSNISAVPTGYNVGSKGQTAGTDYEKLLKNEAAKIRQLSTEFEAFDLAIRNNLTN